VEIGKGSNDEELGKGKKGGGGNRGGRNDKKMPKGLNFGSRGNCGNSVVGVTVTVVVWMLLAVTLRR
jgi:hypothetical protein